MAELYESLNAEIEALKAELAELRAKIDEVNKSNAT